MIPTNFVLSGICCEKVHNSRTWNVNGFAYIHTHSFFSNILLIVRPMFQYTFVYAHSRLLRMSVRATTACFRLALEVRDDLASFFDVEAGGRSAVHFLPDGVEVRSWGEVGGV